MKTLLLLALSAALVLSAACTDDDCATCPQVQSPEQPVTASIVGYWDAVTCEGMYVEDEQYVHSLTMRRDGSYTEYDSAVTSTCCDGTYELLDTQLKMTPDGSSDCQATWVCRVTADTLVLCRCADDHTPAWVFVRSTEN